MKKTFAISRTSVARALKQPAAVITTIGVVDQPLHRMLQLGSLRSETLEIF